MVLPIIVITESRIVQDIINTCFKIPKLPLCGNNSIKPINIIKFAKNMSVLKKNAVSVTVALQTCIISGEDLSTYFVKQKWYTRDATVSPKVAKLCTNLPMNNNPIAGGIKLKLESVINVDFHPMLQIIFI